MWIKDSATRWAAHRSIAKETGLNNQNLSDQKAHGRRWEEACVYFETEKYSVAVGYCSKYFDYCI